MLIRLQGIGLSNSGEDSFHSLNLPLAFSHEMGSQMVGTIAKIGFRIWVFSKVVRWIKDNKGLASQVRRT